MNSLDSNDVDEDGVDNEVKYDDVIEEKEVIMELYGDDMTDGGPDPLAMALEQFENRKNSYGDLSIDEGFDNHAFNMDELETTEV